MENMTCAPISIPATKSLLIKNSGVASVWNVSVPTWSLKSSDAHKERDGFLQGLLEKYPYCSLWISDVTHQPSVGWHVLVGPDAFSRLEQLYQGGWALFLFQAAPAVPLQNIEYMPLPSQREEAVELFNSSSACAAIFSWEDDIEWTVVIRNHLE